MKMGTFHFIDEMRVKIFYRGNENTCGRCHQARSKCPGQAVAKVCQENKGEKDQLSDHMRKLWAEIGFNPTSFERMIKMKKNLTLRNLTQNKETAVIAEKVALIKTPMTEKNLGKVAGIKLDNVPREKTEGDTVELLEKQTKLNKDELKIVMKESGKENTTVRVTNGIELEDIMNTIDKIDYKEKNIDRSMHKQL